MIAYHIIIVQFLLSLVVGDKRDMEQFIMFDGHLSWDEVICQSFLDTFAINISKNFLDLCERNCFARAYLNDRNINEFFEVGIHDREKFLRGVNVVNSKVQRCFVILQRLLILYKDHRFLHLVGQLVNFLLELFCGGF